ncbi:hypothetical protein D3C77_620700 [compost metagenome]
MELGAVVFGDAHHLAAELPVPELQQRLATAIEHADAVRPVELVAGHHVEIAGERLQVVATVHHALRAVDDGQRALRPGQRQHSLQRLPAAQHVG